MQDLKSQRTVESDSSWHFVGAQCDRADPLDHGQNSPVFISLRGCSRHFSTGQNKAECCAPKRTSAKIAHGFYEYTPWLGVARIQPSSKSSLMWRCSKFFSARSCAAARQDRWLARPKRSCSRRRARPCLAAARSSLSGMNGQKPDSTFADRAPSRDRAECGARSVTSR